MARLYYMIQFEFYGPKHTSGTTEARIVKFLTQVGYINVTKRMTYNPLNGWE